MSMEKNIDPHTVEYYVLVRTLQPIIENVAERGIPPATQGKNEPCPASAGTPLVIEVRNGSLSTEDVERIARLFVPARSAEDRLSSARIQTVKKHGSMLLNIEREVQPMKRILALVLIVALCAALFSGCSKKDEEGSAASGKTSLKVVTQFGGEDPSASLFTAMVKEWETKTGNKVTNDSAKADNVWKSKVIADFTTGSEPDVMFFFNGATAAPILDKIVDVETIQGVDPEYGKNIRESVLKAANNLNSEGKPFSLPIRGYAEGLFCNETLFEEHGVALPTDWNSLMAAIAAFKAKGIIPMSVSLGGEAHYYFDHLILSIGGEKAMAVNPRSEAEIPDSWSRGLSLLKVLYDAGAFPEDTASMTGEDARIYFRKGEAAMYLDGSWFGVVGEDTEGATVKAEDVTVVPFPSYTESENQPGTILSGFSSGWYISKKAWNDSNKRAAAIDFVKFMSSDEAIVRYVEAGGGFSASDTAKIDESKLTVQQKQFIELLKNAPSTPMVAQDALEKPAFEVYLANATKLAKGEVTPEAVLRELVANNQAA